MRRLKMDNKTIKFVTRLVYCHDDRPVQYEKSPVNVRISVHTIGKDIYDKYLELVYADFQGKSDHGKEKGFDGYLYVKKQYEEIVENDICTSKKELKITGKDLIAIGCPKGEIIGDILENLLKKVLENPKLNQKEILKDIAGTMF